MFNAHSGKNSSQVPHQEPALAFSIECRVKTTHPIWAFVTGVARGQAIEIAPKTLIVMPAYLEDYCGRYVLWSKPEPGQPIWTGKPITSRPEAQRAFVEWAQQMFEKKWQPSTIRTHRLLGIAAEEMT